METALEGRPPSLLEERDLCFFNGIDGATGEYLAPPLSTRQVADLARREPRYHLPGSPHRERARSGPQDKGPGEGVDPGDLGQTGWGVIFSPSVSPEVREALSPLLAHRRSQAQRERKIRYRELSYQAGETKTGFLMRHGVAPGPAEPDRMPYYLLLVGDPEEMPFELQYQLDVQYAVGRLCFDTPEEYALYARTVVEAETGTLRRSQAAAFFGPRNDGDPATVLSSDHLAAPLAQDLSTHLPDWSVQAAIGEAATKARLGLLLGGDETPALLFTASHGVFFQPDDPRQVRLQGSLVCQDWTGPGHPIRQDHYFSADDVPDGARIAGLIAFHFSCYGAGTPRSDDFPEPVSGQREIAPRAFLSRLARRMLAHPKGAALAVVGHVDRAWSWSFGGPEGREHTLRPVFGNTLQRLTAGSTIGFAMEYFNACYAELASDLDDELRRSRDDGDPRIANLWTSRNDARNYALLGDPAVRLAVAPAEEVR